MTIITPKRSAQCLIGAALLAVLMIALTQAGTVPLRDGELQNHLGAGFWQDPCTWDGFLAGAGSVLCATGNKGGCLTAFVGWWRAIKVDKCF